jgi:hypothetical protein
MRFGTTVAALLSLAPSHGWAKGEKLDSKKIQADMKTKK